MLHFARLPRRTSLLRSRSTLAWSRTALAALGLLLVAGTVHAQSVWIGFDKILRVNGQRFFPVGLLDLGIEQYPDDWNDRIRQSGANTVWDLGFAYSESLATCAAIRDSALATGYYVVTGSPDTWNWDNPNTPEFEVDNPMYENGLLENLDQCFPWNTRHLGYANRDEPVWTISRGQVGDIDSLHVLETFEQLHDVDGARPVVMNFAPAHLSKDLQTWKNDVSGYIPATDIVLFASYPYPAGPGTCSDFNVLGWPECKMDRLPIAADIFLNELNEPGQPLWMIVQAHKSIPLKESRWEATQSIIHGATGLLWAGWTWYHELGSGADNWDVTRQVISEFASIAPSLAQPKLDGVSDNQADVDTFGRKDVEEEGLVFAASRNGYSGPATIHVPGNLDAEWAEVLFEQRWIPVNGDQFTDTFDGYEAHVYRIYRDPEAPTAAPEIAAAGEFALRVFPNPAEGSVRATFTAPADLPVEFAVYDVLGRRVADVNARNRTDTSGEIRWDAVDDAGRRVPAGTYFLRAVAADGRRTTSKVQLR
ncbi:MAG: T9SS type A sorting domain-containing protein [bacterium]